MSKNRGQSITRASKRRSRFYLTTNQGNKLNKAKSKK